MTIRSLEALLRVARVSSVSQTELEWSVRVGVERGAEKRTS